MHFVLLNKVHEQITTMTQKPAVLCFNAYKESFKRVRA